MKLVLFHQYDQLLAKFKAIASDCARDAADWKTCRVVCTCDNVIGIRGLCLSQS